MEHWVSLAPHLVLDLVFGKHYPPEVVKGLHVKRIRRIVMHRLDIRVNFSLIRRPCFVVVFVGKIPSVLGALLFVKVLQTSVLV